MARKSGIRNAPCKTDKPATSAQDSDHDTRAARVGGHLRGIYDDVLAERVPDIFEDLLRKLG